MAKSEKYIINIPLGLKNTIIREEKIKELGLPKNLYALQIKYDPWIPYVDL